MLPQGFYFSPNVRINSALVARAELMFGSDWMEVVSTEEGAGNRIIAGDSVLRWSQQADRFTMTSEYDGVISNPSPKHPAHITFYEDGGIASEAYWTGGIAQNPFPDIPCETAYFIGGNIRRTCFYENGKRTDPSCEIPGEVEYYQSGEVRYVGHYKDGFLSPPPDGSPAYIQYNKDGTVHHGLMPGGIDLSADEVNAMLDNARHRQLEEMVGSEFVLAKSSSAAFPFSANQNTPTR